MTKNVTREAAETILIEIQKKFGGQMFKANRKPLFLKYNDCVIQITERNSKGLFNIQRLQ